MTVYFIKPIGMDGPIKIGSSQSPNNRCKSLDTWSPFPLEIVAQIDGCLDLEWRFHARFQTSHERREWFTWSRELQDVIDSINAGTFDVSSLPEARRTDGVGTYKRTDATRKMLSYSLRITQTVKRTGYSCPIDHRGMIEAGDNERIAIVDAYLADPAHHGIPILGEWARRIRAGLAA